MKKTYRIKQEREFQLIMAQKNSFANRNFVIYLGKKQQPYFRVGLSVGKKVGNAVVRNYIKRQIREQMIHFRPEVTGEWDLIIIARPNVVNLSYQEIGKNMEHVFKLAQIL